MSETEKLRKIIQNGDFEAIKQLLKSGPNDNICHLAAKYGQLDILKYAHENGCEWNSETCAWAAANGHLDCLCYAHDNGCEWNWRHVLVLLRMDI